MGAARPTIQHSSWPIVTDLGIKQGQNHPLSTDLSSRRGLHQSPTTHPPTISANLRPPPTSPLPGCGGRAAASARSPATISCAAFKTAPTDTAPRFEKKVQKGRKIWPPAGS